ncbi:uncharacterized protein EDB91DRAFT_1097622 [Suillus paluster]|uniref:uncharacterized protein n=1 Tax=Suillus paluster TaxID=48578 RepID=UPI001B863A0B|nr:uncharacterized protein EDB91DRAFT_1097622 [Suillus paluster]KAG1755169.1 hypothetical protein EDB91DRAFT_1097622 [Suillus paluster]
MNNTPTSRATPPGFRRSSSVATSLPSAKSVSTARPALASVRAPNSQGTAVSRRSSLKAAPAMRADPEFRESLTVSLKHETEKKEQLLVQVQIKDQMIANLTAENDNVMSVLNLAESRLNDLYADQARMEEEMAARIEVAEKLRTQVRELEREKRDLQRRYNEQTSTFEAERQAFYDNEQHLRSRIQSLTQARKVAEPPRSADATFTTDSSRLDRLYADAELETEISDVDVPRNHEEQHCSTRQDLNDPESEPAEMTALKLELSTLSTSYTSLQSTLILLQAQLVDLKRVNNQLQEDNESYMILLREKTLSGQFDLLKQVGGAPNTTDGGYDDDEVVADDSADVGSLRSTSRSVLDRVEEEMTEDDDLEQRRGADSPSSHRHGRHGRRNDSASHSPSRAPRGESLADLPITGPGLDLAAELGRAENKDILSGDSIDSDRSLLSKGRRKRESTDTRKVSSDTPDSNSDLEALRSEVKTLKDANKALSLYASKIIDRIIAEEGFEHVLSVDYDKSPTTHSNSNKSPTSAVTTTASAPAKASKSRPQSAFFYRATSDSAATPRFREDAIKSQRRSMSFDWKNFSMFGGAEKKPEPANLRPLTLKPSSTPMTSARKLETYEDEEDRRERERLHATMKLMGIEQPAPSPLVPGQAVPMQKSYSIPESPQTATASRFSIFRSRSTTGHSDTSSINSGPSVHSSHQSTYELGLAGNGPSELTQEALEQAEAENSLAALDAHEQILGEEIAKGRSGGFTELSPRSLGEEWRSRRSRSRRSGGGSGSTVWSAGMSRTGDEPDT